MKRKVKIVIAVIITLSAVFLYAHIGKTHTIYNADVDSSKYKDTGTLVNSEITQSFECLEDTMDALLVKCKLIGEPKDASISYELRENGNSKIAAKGKIAASKIKSNKFQKLAFKTLTGCRNKTYTLVLKAEDADEDSNIVFSYEGKTRTGTRLLINDESEDGTLILKTVTNRFDVETFIVMLLFVLYIVVFMRFLYKMFR